MRLTPLWLLTGLVLPLVLATTPTVATGAPAKPQPPVVLGPGGDGFLATMPDGRIDMIYARKTSNGMEVVRKRTADNGHTWSSPESLYALNPADFGARLPWATLPLVTRDGQLQLFFMVERGSGSNPAVDDFIDLWQVCSRRLPSSWSPHQCIFKGYVGSLNGVTQLRSGRIVLPFAYWLGGQPAGPPYGNNIVTTVYSDDGGNTWRQSPAQLKAPCSANHNSDNLGAIEPTILQLNDGRVWMLIRTQTGFLYESFSRDGANWSAPTPSRFRSSDSPSWLLRLADQRIVLFWNNCENTSRIDGKGVYTNRDALHAAISADEGKTWQGHREVYRDPLRNQSLPKNGDRGAAYPYPTATKDGRILMITGQGDGRRNLVLVDPAWLEATSAEDDFSHGLDGWSVFKSFGPADNWWRDRVQGAELVDHPTKAGAKALHVRRPDAKDGDGAVWNFSSGPHGQASIRLQLQPGCQGVGIGLADRFIQPTDSAGERQQLFHLTIGRDNRLPDGATLTPGQWYTLALRWDLGKNVCQVLLDNRQVGVLTPLNADSRSPGPCYLRLRSTAPGVDNAGMLVEWVRANT
jgi:hypothetical protein